MRQVSEAGNQTGSGVDKRPGLRALRWSATAAAIVAAILVASNTEATKWGFVIFSVASVLWIGAGLADRIYSLATLNAVLLVVNLVGIWRWFA
ncbi:hypothetical protein [Desertibaculum subflavum]|uniref:hypothetical protein n=1 Tax=Desertibaculum subflavum TaxID=2268458 RepID=UPI0013C4B2B8